MTSIISKKAQKLALSKSQEKLLGEYISKIQEIDLNDDETGPERIAAELDILWAALTPESRKQFYEYKQKKNSKQSK